MTVFRLRPIGVRVCGSTLTIASPMDDDLFSEVGLYTLTPPDPQLKGAWFQTLHTSSEKNRFQSLPFKFNLHRYSEAHKLAGDILVRLYKLNQVDP
jgi:hypothetical protein